MRLKHWPRVPTGLLGLLFEAPVVADLHWLRDEIATTEDHFAVARLVEQRRRFVRDTVRMLGVIRRDDDNDSFDIRRYKSWKSLKALHDRLIPRHGAWAGGRCSMRSCRRSRRSLPRRFRRTSGSGN